MTVPLDLPPSLDCLFQVGTKIINPKGLNPSGGVYPDEIYANFPVMLRRLSYIYVVLAAIGSLAIKDPPSTDGGNEARFGKKVVTPQAEGLSLGEALKTKNFWLMWFMVSFQSCSISAVVKHTVVAGFLLCVVISRGDAVFNVRSYYVYYMYFIYHMYFMHRN